MELTRKRYPNFYFFLMDAVDRISKPAGAYWESPFTTLMWRLRNALERKSVHTSDQNEGSEKWPLWPNYFNTQKVNGLLPSILDEDTWPRPIGVAWEKPLYILPWFPPLDKDELTFPVFARPAPKTPRHGFVESKTVKSMDELVQLWSDTVEQDPDGEMIIMNRLMGNYSAVATNAGITWGMGNDGVTAATSFAAHIPATTPSYSWNQQFGRSLPEGVSSYVELVQHQNETYGEYMALVQVRDGPEQGSGVNYVPRAEVITKIQGVTSWENNYIQGGGSEDMLLLQWEEKIASLLTENGGKPDGLLIYARDMPLASHYAVHAIQNKITVITDHKPLVGQKIVPTYEVPMWKPRNFLQMKTQLQRWSKRNYLYNQHTNLMRNVAATSYATAHSMSLWGMDTHLIRIRAFAIDAMLRMLTSACAGEIRHWETSGPGRSKNFSTWEAKKSLSLGEVKSKVGPSVSVRDIVYDEFVKPIPLFTRQKLLDNMQKDFTAYGWDHGFGGNAWATVAEATANLNRGVRRFTKRPNLKTWMEVESLMNRAANAMHNNGKTLSKWLPDKLLNTIAYTPTLGFSNVVAGRLALGMRIGAHIPDGDTILGEAE